MRELVGDQSFAVPGAVAVISAEDRNPLGFKRYLKVIVAFFAINLGFITYIVDIEQLTVAVSQVGDAEALESA